MKQQLVDKFQQIYGDGAVTGIYFAPGRVNLIGEHTDYNGGHVFPCAITMGTYALVRKRTDNRFRFCSLNYPDQGVLELPVWELDWKREHGWANYPKGMICTLMKKGVPVICGMDLLYYGDIPKGLGIGSSASLEVVTGLIIRDLMEIKDLSMIDLALFARLAENEYIGMSSGIMDPFAIAMGKKDHAILLDTSDLSYEYAPLELPHQKIIVTNSQKARLAVDERYQERQAQCQEALHDLQTVIAIQNLSELTADVFEQVQEMIRRPVCLRRARHAVTENQRTIQAVEALNKGDIREFGQVALNNNRENNRISLLTIIGEIEGHDCLPATTKTTKYEHVLPKLAEMEDNRDTEGILLLLNTVGGDVESGLAIAEMIASISKPTVSLVLGGSHSIGVPLAVSTDYSFIVPSGTMVIHPVRMSGTVIGAKPTYDYFKQMQNRILTFIASHSKAGEERLEELMMNTGMLTKDLGTILVGEEAVREGLIDAVGGIDAAFLKLHAMIDAAKGKNY